MIDASVAQAAGDEMATDPIAQTCRDFLLAAQLAGYRLVLTPEIKAEWDHHQSGFARGWLRAMVVAQQVDFVQPAPSEPLRKKILSAAANERDRLAMDEDFLLIEAALATDRVVISRDNKSRAPFAAVSHRAGARALLAIAWLNPDKTDVITWLARGAERETEYLLGLRGA